MAHNLQVDQLLINQMEAEEQHSEDQQRDQAAGGRPVSSRPYCSPGLDDVLQQMHPPSLLGPGAISALAKRRPVYLQGRGRNSSVGNIGTRPLGLQRRNSFTFEVCMPGDVAAAAVMSQAVKVEQHNIAEQICS